MVPVMNLINRRSRQRGQMDDELVNRRRRAHYRANHRGTREMDLLLGRFAAIRLDAMNEDELAKFEQLLFEPDPELQALLMADNPDWNNTPLDITYRPLIEAIRSFHAKSGKDPA